MDIEFGVQVIRPFEGEGEVIYTETPAGEVAMVTHIGSYDRLAAAYDAIHAWQESTGRAFAGYSWEIYGDWADDATKLETEVVYLLN
jgi:effector-binding domain-containing protein